MIGINFVDEKDKLIEQYQTSGIVIEVTEIYIKLRRDDQSTYFIPNDMSLIKETKKGFYRERNTEKEIESPDFISQWKVCIKNPNDVNKYKEIGFEPID